MSNFCLGFLQQCVDPRTVDIAQPACGEPDNVLAISVHHAAWTPKIRSVHALPQAQTTPITRAAVSPSSSVILPGVSLEQCRVCVQNTHAGTYRIQERRADCEHGDGMAATTQTVRQFQFNMQFSFL